MDLSYIWRLKRTRFILCSIILSIVCVKTNKVNKDGQNTSVFFLCPKWCHVVFLEPGSLRVWHFKPRPHSWCHMTSWKASNIFSLNSFGLLQRLYLFAYQTFSLFRTFWLRLIYFNFCTETINFVCIFTLLKWRSSNYKPMKNLSKLASFFFLALT